MIGYCWTNSTFLGTSRLCMTQGTLEVVKSLAHRWYSFHLDLGDGLLTWPALCGSETVPQRLFFMLTTSHDQYAIIAIWKLFHKLSPVFPALRSSYSGSKRTLSPFPRPLQPRKEEVWQNKSSPPSSGPGRQMTAELVPGFEFFGIPWFFSSVIISSISPSCRCR